MAIRLAQQVSKQAIGMTAGLVTAGLFAIPQMAYSAEVSTKNLQNLTCAQHGQQLICNLNSAIAQNPTQNQNGFEPVGTTDTQPFAGQTHPTHLLSAEQDELISNILLGFLYFVLPVGFGLALWFHDRNTDKRIQQFNQQIALLERIWHHEPQS